MCIYSLTWTKSHNQVGNRRCWFLLCYVSGVCSHVITPTNKILLTFSESPTKTPETKQNKKALGLGGEGEMCATLEAATSCIGKKMSLLHPGCGFFVTTQLQQIEAPAFDSDIHPGWKVLPDTSCHAFLTLCYRAMCSQWNASSQLVLDWSWTQFSCAVRRRMKMQQRMTHCCYKAAAFKPDHGRAQPMLTSQPDHWCLVYWL